MTLYLKKEIFANISVQWHLPHLVQTYKCHQIGGLIVSGFTAKFITSLVFSILLKILFFGVRDSPVQRRSVNCARIMTDDPLRIFYFFYFDFLFLTHVFLYVSVSLLLPSIHQKYGWSAPTVSNQNSTSPCYNEGNTPSDIYHTRMPKTEAC